MLTRAQSTYFRCVDFPRQRQEDFVQNSFLEHRTLLLAVQIEALRATPEEKPNFWHIERIVGPFDFVELLPETSERSRAGAC